MKNPCYNCQKRVVGCHSTCDDYKSFREEKDKLKQKIKKEQFADAYISQRQCKKMGEIAERDKKDRRYKRK